MSKENASSFQGINNIGILALILSRGITNLPGLVVSLLLVDIANNFNVPVGIAGQIRTTSGILSIIFGFVMGVLSIKYRHRSLLSLGLILFIISTVTSYYSTTFTMLLAFYSLAGIAISMVNPMVNTLIGSHIQPEKRTTVMGWTIAGLSIIYLLGSLSSGYFAPWGWRMALMLVVVPLSLLTCILCRLHIPGVKQENITSVNSLFSGYGAVLRNKSALGCIIGTVLGLTTWNIYLIYGASYWRQVFAIQVTTIALAMIFTSLSYTAGSLLTGKVTKRIGIRRTLLFTTGILGGITLFAFNAQSFIISIALASVASFLAGSMITSSSSFSLGQVPEYSGTMMSLHSVAVSLGGTLSALFGGVFLLSFGYGGYAVILGVVGLVAALVFQFLTVEPVRLRA